MKSTEPHTHAPYHLRVRTEEEHSILRRLLVDHWRTTSPGIWTHGAALSLLLEMDHSTLHCNCNEPEARSTEPYLGDMY